MNEIEKYTNKIFEDIKHIDENGNEYWEARELAKILEYSKWSNFKKVIALGETYFTIQTRKQELTEIEFSNLSEDEKRLYTRKIVKNKRSKLIFTSFYILSFSNLSNIFVKHSGSSLVNSIYFFVLG